MTAIELVKRGLGHSKLTTKMMLAELTDEEILARPAEGANHIAWQLGHLIAAENYFMNMVSGGKMPPLPDGFAKQHDNDHAKSDSIDGYLTKEEYLRLWKQQREATLGILDTLSDTDLDEPAPEKVRAYFPTIGELLLMCPMHEMWHQGQFGVCRRKLGKPHAF